MLCLFYENEVFKSTDFKYHLTDRQAPLLRPPPQVHAHLHAGRVRQDHAPQRMDGRFWILASTHQVDPDTPYQQPKSIQTLLPQASLLDRLTAPLCDTVVADIGQKRNAMPESVFLPLVRVLDNRHSAEPAGWDN